MRLYDLRFFFLSYLPNVWKLLSRVVNLKYIAFPPTGRCSDSPKNRNSETVSCSYVVFFTDVRLQPRYVRTTWTLAGKGFTEPPGCDVYFASLYFMVLASTIHSKLLVLRLKFDANDS